MDSIDSIKEDPCFFRLNDGKRNIYVLGSAHIVKIENCVSANTLKILTSIAEKEKPILFTEHATSNEGAFKILQSIKMNAQENWSQSIYKQEYEFLLNDKILINKETLSELTIKNLFSIPIWLAAPILSTHCSIIFYTNFGGTEYDLENSGSWKGFWSAQQYLEDDNHYELLKSCAVADNQHNIEWIKKSLEKLSLIYPLIGKSAFANMQFPNPAYKENILVQEKETCKKTLLTLIDTAKNAYINQNWEVLNFNEDKYLPTSVLLRNVSWSQNIKVFADKLNEKPFLLVVGNGHLALFDKGKSFLFYLMQVMNIKKIERFSNKSNAWIEL